MGPAPDLLIGCGLAWFVAAAVVWGSGGGLERLIPGGLLVFALSLPHYGATLLRVYETREERQRYAFFAVHATVAVVLLFVVAVASPLVGSLVVTLYMTWSPWHYTGQNYGVLLMMLGRRGVSVDPRTKRFIHVSFALSFGLTFLALHAGDSGTVYAPASAAGTVYQLVPLGIPTRIAYVLFAGVALAYAVTTGVAVTRLARRGRFEDLLPALLLMATQALWFSIPVLARLTGAFDRAGLGPVYSAYGFLWIAGAHSAQYLWVTLHFAETSGRAPHRGRYLLKTACAGFTVWVLPGLIFAPYLLGGAFAHVSAANLALLTAATVNLHHFILDGAIWKLRDGRIARLLKRDPDPAAMAAPASNGRSALSVAFWVVGSICVVAGVFGYAEKEFGYRRAMERGDLHRAAVALDRLGWVARDGASERHQLAKHMLAAGNRRAGLLQARRSLELRESPQTWTLIAEDGEASRNWERAARAWDAAHALEPERARFLYRSGLAWSQAGEPDRAVERLSRAAELAPNESRIALSLARAARATEGQVGSEAVGVPEGLGLGSATPALKE